MADNNWAQIALALGQAGLAAYSANKAQKAQKNYAQQMAKPQTVTQSRTPLLYNQGMSDMLKFIMGQAGDLYASRSKAYGRDVGGDALSIIKSFMNPQYGGGSFSGGGASASYADLPKVLRGRV